jgi:hypothetical protein
MLQVWYHSVDIHFILPHVQFEDGSSIWVLKAWAARHKNLYLEIEKFLKKSNVQRLPVHFILNPAFFKFVRAAICQRTGACQFPRWLEHN